MRYIVKIIEIGMAILLLASSVKGVEEIERKSPRNFMVMGRDYSLFEDISVKPISVGVNSWYTFDGGLVPALYSSIAILSYKDIVRFEVGGSTTWNNDRVDISPLTGISTLIEDRIVIGMWFAPFWNLWGSDDDWGGMIGYAFSL